MPRVEFPTQLFQHPSSVTLPPELGTTVDAPNAMCDDVFNLTPVCQEGLLEIRLARTQNSPPPLWLSAIHENPIGQAILHKPLLVEMILSLDVRRDIQRTFPRNAIEFDRLDPLRWRCGDEDQIGGVAWWQGGACVDVICRDHFDGFKATSVR